MSSLAEWGNTNKIEFAVCVRICLVFSPRTLLHSYWSPFSFQVKQDSTRPGKRPWRERASNGKKERFRGRCISGESVKYLGDRSVGRSRHQATAGLVVFARGPLPPSPPPPALYHMYLWLSQPASHQPGLPEGRKDGRMEEEGKKVAVSKEGWEERADWEMAARWARTNGGGRRRGGEKRVMLEPL